MEQFDLLHQRYVTYSDFEVSMKIYNNRNQVKSANLLNYYKMAYIQLIEADDSSQFEFINSNFGQLKIIVS